MIITGWFCLIDLTYYLEPEGAIWFEGEPEIGQKITLSDGLEYQIASIDHTDQIIRVFYPELEDII